MAEIKCHVIDLKYCDICPEKKQCAPKILAEWAVLQFSGKVPQSSGK